MLAGDFAGAEGSKLLSWGASKKAKECPWRSRSKSESKQNDNDKGIRCWLTGGKILSLWSYKMLRSGYMEANTNMFKTISTSIYVSNKSKACIKTIFSGARSGAGQSNKSHWEVEKDQRSPGDGGNTFYSVFHQEGEKRYRWRISLFQRLMHDNDIAGRKLISQEEEWRLQNQTLLEELQKLVLR